MLFCSNIFEYAYLASPVCNFAKFNAQDIEKEIHSIYLCSSKGKTTISFFLVSMNGIAHYFMS